MTQAPSLRSIDKMKTAINGVGAVIGATMLIVLVIGIARCVLVEISTASGNDAAIRLGMVSTVSASTEA